MPHRVAPRAASFIVAVCIVIIALGAWRSWNARAVQLHEMRTAASNLASAMSQQAEDALVETQTALTGIREYLAVDGTGPAALARLHKQLMERSKRLPQLNGIFVYDEKGDWLVTSQSVRRNYNNSDREYFQYHATHSDLEPRVGFPITSKSTGKWVLPVSKRFNHADGSFAGVILATIDLEFFSKFYDSLDIGRAGALALASNDGTLIVRRPYSSKDVGKNLSGSGIFKGYQTAPGHIGAEFFTSPLDGVDRLISYRPVVGFPFFVGAALSKQEILAGWQQDTLWNSAVLAIVVVVIALAGRGLVRQIVLRARSEMQLVKMADELERLNHTLEQLALLDGLTGVANRRQFDATLGNEFRRAGRQASSLALIMIDIDRFKKYNDTYGHAAGDECLKLVCQTIEQVAPKRGGDLVARYGGEEIAVILPHTDEAGALTVAENIRVAVADLNIVHQANPGGFVTLSAGVHAQVPAADSMEPRTLIEAADKALYLAKHSGRDQVCTSRC
jgi:diguanylate cyclase (GGDEF)-like protein